MPDTITLYTQQAQVVLDSIERDGTTMVKWDYINKKYGDQARIFSQPYAFFAQHAPAFVPKPANADSGIWCYCDSRWAVAGAGGALIELLVPRNQVVLFDLRVWNRMLNLQYVAADEADEAAFEQRLASMGVRDASEAFTTAFYPTVKREIVQSWQRLFESHQGCPETYLEAGLWEIRREWVVSMEPL